jgi:hypothetical protein
MINDEKMCPLTKMTCYGATCGWWRRPVGCCSVTTIASALHGADLELGRAVNELYEIRKELERL